MKYRPVAERFEEKIHIEPNCGCWLWTAGVCKKGYGTFELPRHTGSIGAHRLSWQLHRGPIPEGMHVLHRCDIPSCVNPAHLWLGTNADNVADRVKKRRTFNVRKTHCPVGHELVASNLTTNGLKVGKRICATCARGRTKRWKEKQRVRAA
jgi:hypothetical protein